MKKLLLALSFFLFSCSVVSAYTATLGTYTGTTGYSDPGYGAWFSSNSGFIVFDSVNYAGPAIVYNSGVKNNPASYSTGSTNGSPVTWTGANDLPSWFSLQTMGGFATDELLSFRNSSFTNLVTYGKLYSYNSVWSQYFCIYDKLSGVPTSDSGFSHRYFTGFGLHSSNYLFSCPLTALGLLPGYSHK